MCPSYLSTGRRDKGEAVRAWTRLTHGCLGRMYTCNGIQVANHRQESRVSIRPKAPSALKMAPRKLLSSTGVSPSLVTLLQLEADPFLRRVLRPTDMVCLEESSPSHDPLPPERSRRSVLQETLPSLTPSDGPFTTGVNLRTSACYPFTPAFPLILYEVL